MIDRGLVRLPIAAVARWDLAFVFDVVAAPGTGVVERLDVRPVAEVIGSAVGAPDDGRVALDALDELDRSERQPRSPSK